MKTLTTIVLFLSVTLILGCGAPKPPGFPETAPCRVTVLQNGLPVSGAAVVLVCSNVRGPVTADGMTDANGTAVIQTRWGNYTAKGAPVGEHKIAVSKYVELPPLPEGHEEWKGGQWEEHNRRMEVLQDERRILPEQWATADSPLTLTVEKGKTTEITVKAEE